MKTWKKHVFLICTNICKYFKQIFSLETFCLKKGIQVKTPLLFSFPFSKTRFLSSTIVIYLENRKPLDSWVPERDLHYCNTSDFWKWTGSRRQNTSHRVGNSLFRFFALSLFHSKSLFLKSDRERIAHVALSLTKNERFARKTDERIPNPVSAVSARLQSTDNRRISSVPGITLL